MPETLLPLYQVIQGLRTELYAAVAAGKNELLTFDLGPIEMEFTVVAKREGGPNGKIKFEIFGIGAELGADAKVGTERTQKMKLTLNPKMKAEDGTRGSVPIGRKPKK